MPAWEDMKMTNIMLIPNKFFGSTPYIDGRMWKLLDQGKIAVER
jgi:hypothetical protein